MTHLVKRYDYQMLAVIAAIVLGTLAVTRLVRFEERPVPQKALAAKPAVPVEARKAEPPSAYLVALRTAEKYAPPVDDGSVVETDFQTGYGPYLALARARGDLRVGHHSQGGTAILTPNARAVIVFRYDYRVAGSPATLVGVWTRVSIDDARDVIDTDRELARALVEADRRFAEAAGHRYLLHGRDGTPPNAEDAAQMERIVRANRFE